MAVRKSVTSLTPDERAKFVTGVKQMKASGVYDRYVTDHASSMRRATPFPGVDTADTSIRNAAHRGPAFLPWHREFILRFEADLQAAVGDSDFGLPYWDWAADASLDDPTKAVIWSDDFMGGDGKPVQSGPFSPAQWTIVPTAFPMPGASGSLDRELGVNATSLPTQADVNEALAIPVYDSHPFDLDVGDPLGAKPSSGPSFRNKLEGWFVQRPQLHNRIHVWVGGSMQPAESPNDPVFFLHHCNVDRLWALWQVCHPQAGYLPVTGGPPEHNLNDAMFPWQNESDPPTPAKVLDISDPRQGYSYDSFHRRVIRLRRTTGDRFVSDQEIEIVGNCDLRDDTSARIFLPASAGGVVRANLGTLTFEPKLIPADDEINVTN